jgi:hypothetical protein
METNFQINDKATIAGKTYRVYNIMAASKLVCFGRISATTGKDLSAMNPHNILTLTFADVAKFEKLGTIAK